MSTAQFHPEDFVTYGGRAHHRSVIHQKIAAMGWTPQQTSQLTDEQVKQVIDQRLSPDQMTLTPTAPGSSVVLMNEDDDAAADEASIMGPEAPAQPASGIVMESDVQPPAIPGQPAQPVQGRLTNVRPPGAAAPGPAAQPKPATPTIGAQPVPEPEPAPAPPPPPPKPVAPILPKPATDMNQFKALLDAVVALGGPESSTAAQAAGLATAHSLWDALKAYNKEVYEALDGDQQPRMDEAQETCIGSMILKTEVANGAIHIITTEGTLTLTGTNINLCKQQ